MNIELATVGNAVGRSQVEVWIGTVRLSAIRRGETFLR